VKIDGLPNTPGVYQITNTTTGECYVGQANNLMLRVKGHRDALHRHQHANTPLQKAVDIHGLDAFVVNVLEHVARSPQEDEDQFSLRLRELEDGYIYVLQPAYNDTGTHASRGRRSAEYRERLRLRRENPPPEPYRIGNKVWPSYAVYVERQRVLDRAAGLVKSEKGLTPE